MDDADSRKDHIEGFGEGVYSDATDPMYSPEAVPVDTKWEKLKPSIIVLRRRQSEMIKIRTIVGIFVGIFLCACSCSYEVREDKADSLVLNALKNLKETSDFECSSSLFKEVEELDILKYEEKEFEFARISNADSMINGTCYKLFYLKSK